MRRTLLAVAVAASLLTPLWDLLAPLWGGSEDTDAGCIWDPYGRCLPAPQTDEGCGWDPYGRCQPAPQTDAGCGWDPYGSPCGS
jgi:hypothetical protein